MPKSKAVAPFTIMPLGDSITAGLVLSGVVAGGYRAKLQRLLVQSGSPLAGQPIMFGGLRNNNNNGNSTLYANHAGIGGETAEQILSRTGAELASCNPQVVLLHAGTNNAVLNSNVSGAHTTIASIVDTCLAYPSVRKVYVADIINCKASDVATFNNLATIRSNLPGALASAIATGKCHYITGFNGLIADPGEFFSVPDTIHPGLVGYDKMADKWYADAFVAFPVPL